jgi:transcriptional regulator GlxA family with amidase domain
LFNVACVSRDGQAIQARAGLRVLPEHGFADNSVCNLLLIPGGVVDAAINCPQTLDWIARTAAQAQIAASVCTGAFLLAASGVLHAGRVTTHWEDIADLQARYSALTVCEGPRWIAPESTCVCTWWNAWSARHWPSARRASWTTGGSIED